MKDYKDDFQKRCEAKVAATAEELEALAGGTSVICPYCGELSEAPEDANCWTCEHCNEEQTEAYGLANYLEDVYDVKYTMDARGRFDSVRLAVALGGPNIYVDTDDAAVHLYWGTNRATAYLSRDTADVIEDFFIEYFEIAKGA